MIPKGPPVLISPFHDYIRTRFIAILTLWWMDTNQRLVDSLGGVSTCTQFRTGCSSQPHVPPFDVSYSVRRWGVDTDLVCASSPSEEMNFMCTRICQSLTCQQVVMLPSLCSCCCCGLLRGTTLGLVHVDCGCRNTLCLPLSRTRFLFFFFLSMLAFLFCKLTWPFFLHGCWLSHTGCWRGNHRKKHDLFAEL